MGFFSSSCNGGRRCAQGASRLLFAVGLWAAASAVLAAPYTPANDDVVLEQLPAANELRALAPLRRQLAAHPNDLNTALALAKQFIELSRKEADPRFLGYAEATLQPWLKQPTAPASVLVLEATVLQSRHQFDDSLAMLARALKLDPANAQAWLTRATVLRVQGRYAEARPACARLDQWIAITCLTAINGLSGQLAGSYVQLQRLLVIEAGAPPALRAWTLTELGEMAERLADRDAAERYYRTALQVTPDDVYLRAAYADLLLDEGRNADVIALLRGNERQDVLLMRLAIAGTRAGSTDGARWADMFDARYAAAQRDGTTTHMREEARFMLEVRHRPELAAELAQRNWQVQHEPADVRLLFEVAAAAKRPALAQTARDWIAQNHFEDRRLLALTGPSGPAKAAP